MEINNNLFDALGMTLIDSLWQGAIIMTIAFVGLWVMKKSKAELRHNFLLTCILVLPVLGVYTFSQRYEPAAAYVETLDPQDIGFISHSAPRAISAPVSTALNIQNEAFQWVEMTPWIGVFWTVGMFLIFLRAAGGYLYLNRLKSSAFPLENIELNGLFNKLKGGFDLKREVLLKESMKISSPMVYGYFKPVILFPIGLIQGLTTDEVEVILLHELAHLKRNDFLINIVINGLRAVYFYHPVFWWLQSQLDNEREFASDEMVMEHQRDGLTLVRALTKAKEFSMLSPSLGFAGSSKNQLLKRVNRIMKQQQKPNWAGLLLPSIILLSVFLFTSQKKVTENSEEENEQVQEATAGTGSGLEVLTFDMDKPGIVESADPSILTFDIPDVQEKKDSVTVAKATMELLEDQSPVKVTTDSEGIPTRIQRNGKRLMGKTLEVYTEAYMRLNKYSSKVADKRMSDFMGSNPQKLEEMVKLAGLNSANPDPNLRSKGLNKLFELESQLLQERQRLGQLMSNDKTKENQTLLTEQANKVDQIKLVILDLIKSMTEEEQELYKLRGEALEKQEQLMNVSQAKDLNKSLVAVEKLQQTIQSEEAKLSQMIQLASEDPENTDPKALNDQVIMLDQLKRELSAYANNADKQSDYEKLLAATRDQQDAKTAAILQKQQEVVALRDQIEAKQREGDLFRSTVYSDDHKLYEFPSGAANDDVWKLVEQPIQKLGNEPILEVDGKLRPDLKFSDLKKEDIVSIQIFKGKAQASRYPKGETKDYSGIISIVTLAKKELIKDENGQKKESPFSKKRTVYGFSEDKGGQKYATMVINDAKEAYENSVLVLDGKFLPTNSLLEYKKPIKTIKVYRGEALKKFPKRKVKSYDTVIEISTQK